MTKARLGLVGAVLLLAGCGQSAPDLLAQVEEAGVECVQHTDPSDDLAVCNTPDGPIAVQRTENVDLLLAISLDRGDPGPWVIGDGWLVATQNDQLAATVAAALEGDVVRSMDDYYALTD